MFFKLEGSLFCINNTPPRIINIATVAINVFFIFFTASDGFFVGFVEFAAHIVLFPVRPAAFVMQQS